MVQSYRTVILVFGIASLLLYTAFWPTPDASKSQHPNANDESVITSVVRDIQTVKLHPVSVPVNTAQRSNITKSSTFDPVRDVQQKQSDADSMHVDNEKLERRMASAIIVGAGKCGTDALVTFLNTSDEFAIDSVHRENMEELNYFNYNYNEGKQWYIDNMPPSRMNQITIEKCAPYLWNPEVPKRVRETNPDMKLIFVFCDPVKRAVSLYTHINSYKYEDGTDPLPAFTDLVYLDSVSGQLKETVHPRPSQPFLECSKYVVFVNQWLQYFPIRQMVFVNGEQLIVDPLLEVAKVTKFLGKPKSVTAENIYFSESRGYYCFANSNAEKWCMDRKTKGRKHPDLPSNLIIAMHNHYKPYNEQLYSLVGINFSWPKYFGNTKQS